MHKRPVMQKDIVEGIMVEEGLHDNGLNLMLHANYMHKDHHKLMNDIMR